MGRTHWQCVWRAVPQLWHLIIYQLIAWAAVHCTHSSAWLMLVSLAASARSGNPALLFLKFIFIGVCLLYNVALVSTIQKNQSATCMHISPPFGISFPFRLPQRIKCWLLIRVPCAIQQVLIRYLFDILQSQPPPVLLPGKSHGWRSLVGCSPWGR